MDPKRPSTWNRFLDHPSFAAFQFGDDWMTWYGGDDPDGDLATLANVATNLLSLMPQAAVELIVLDDVTTFVQIKCGTLDGRFGSGCDDGTCYLYLDSNPSDPGAPELEEIDNLTPGQLVDTAVAFWNSVNK